MHEKPRSRSECGAILLVGRPGSGKRTTAKILEKEHGLLVYDSKAQIQEREKRGELTESALEIVSKGLLLPDSVVFNFFEDFLKENGAFKQKRPLVVDGIPRNLSQAEKVLEMLKDAGYRRILVADLYIMEPDANRRVQKDESRVYRTNPAEVQRRQDVFDRETSRVIRWLSSLNGGNIFHTQITSCYPPDQIARSVLCIFNDTMCGLKGKAVQA